MWENEFHPILIISDQFLAGYKEREKWIYMDNMRIDRDILTWSYFFVKSVWQTVLSHIHPYVQKKIAETAKYLLFSDGRDRVPHFT